MTKYLTSDQTGYNRKQYGCKGDRVEVISIHGEVAIVELSGNRFPVRSENLSETEVKKDVQIKRKK